MFGIYVNFLLFESFSFSISKLVYNEHFQRASSNIEQISTMNKLKRRVKIKEEKKSYRLVKLIEHCRRSVTPRWIVGHFCAAQRTRLLPIEPMAHAQFTENVTAFELHRRRVIIVTNWTLCSGVFELLFRWSRSETLHRSGIKIFDDENLDRQHSMILTALTTFFNSSINARLTNIAVCTRSDPLATM